MCGALAVQLCCVRFESVGEPASFVYMKNREKMKEKTATLPVRVCTYMQRIRFMFFRFLFVVGSL